jgi:hypothetical protein
MHRTSRIAGMGLSLIVSGALAVVPGIAGGESPGTRAAVGAAATATSTPRTSGPAYGSALCAGLLASGIFGDVLTVAPITAPRRQDSNIAIQSGSIWSDTHQATVESRPAVKPSPVKPAAVSIKLPISFTGADRERFTAAGWKARAEPDGRVMSYCLDRADRSDSAASTAVHGMICVTAAAGAPTG